MEINIVLVFVVLLIIVSGWCVKTDSSNAWDADDDACFYARHHHFRTDDLPFDKQLMLHTALNQLYYENGMRRADSSIKQLCSKYFQPICLPTDAQLQEEVCYYAAHGKFNKYISPELEPYYLNALTAFYYNLQNPLTYYLVMSKCPSILEEIQKTKAKECSECGEPGSGTALNIESRKSSETVAINQSDIHIPTNLKNHDFGSVLIAAILKKYNVSVNNNENGTDISIHVPISNTGTKSYVNKPGLDGNSISQTISTAESNEKRSDIDENKISQNVSTVELLELASTKTQENNHGKESGNISFVSGDKFTSQNNTPPEVVESGYEVIETYETTRRNTITESVESRSNLDTRDSNAPAESMESGSMIHATETSHNSSTTSSVQSGSLTHENLTSHKKSESQGVKNESKSHANLDSQNDRASQVAESRYQNHRKHIPATATARGKQDGLLSDENLDSQNTPPAQMTESGYTRHETGTSDNSATVGDESGFLLDVDSTLRKYSDREIVEDGSVSHENLDSQNTTPPQMTGSRYTRHEKRNSHISATTINESGSLSDGSVTSREYAAKEIVKGESVLDANSDLHNTPPPQVTKVSKRITNKKL